MKKYLILICYLSLCACAMAKERPSIESNFPVCGQSKKKKKNMVVYQKVC